jgi:hypothetical protein
MRDDRKEHRSHGADERNDPIRRTTERASERDEEF